MLLVSKSYIFRIFFKQFFGICLFGSLHGLCLLPVLLSLVGPAHSPVPGMASSSTESKKAGHDVEVPAMSLDVPTTPPLGDAAISSPPSPPATSHSGRRVAPHDA